MYKKILFLMFLIPALGSLSAQSFIGKINSVPENRGSLQADDTVKILAVMVNFQADRDEATFGTGKFGSIYSKDYGQSIIDPLPHDKNYFEAHLKFVQNYFAKVSGGRLGIEYTVLPDTFSVSKTMRNYSPPGNSADFAPLGDFSTEVWKKADSLYPGFNFGGYDLFIIFHAGVGRDISLPGSIGNERDLPSVYLSLNTLREIYGQNFNGIELSGGFNITNSMIMPETESRELESLGGDVLFEISINGLLAANIASHLGLPDLFDTETGLSAIGKFGLMDGQSIFSYNGLFPPEPSAWEKIALGWAEAVTIIPGDYNINLVTKMAAAAGDTVILRVPISNSEYYLVENRRRDANNDGAIIKYVLGGDTLTKQLRQDVSGFYSFDVDTLEGVVIDVDEFDWSLPGFIDDTSDYGGGILIWHIDEKVISAKRNENKINTDKLNRGVDVEEADGIQDIGERFFTIFGDEVIGEGSYEDYWYSGNPAQLYSNRFSKDTRPNTRGNNGANSLITFSGFSDQGNRMSFNLSYRDSSLKPIVRAQLPADRTGGISRLNIQGSSRFIAYGSDGLTVLDSSGAVLNNISYNSNTGQTVFFNSYAATAFDTTIYIINITDNSVITKYVSGKVNYLSFNESGILYATTDAGTVEIVDPAVPGTESEIAASAGVGFKILKTAVKDDVFGAVGVPTDRGTYGIIIDPRGGIITLIEEFPRDIVMTEDRNGNSIFIISTAGNNLYRLKGDEIKKIYSGNSAENMSPLTLADLKQNGENYIIFNQGSSVHAVNIDGTSAENFPFTDPEGKNFTSVPLAADFEGDSRSEIISATEDGRVYALDGGSGRIVDGFPFAAAGGVSVIPVLFNNAGSSAYGLLSADGLLQAWSIGQTEAKLYWSQVNGSAQQSSFTEQAANTNAMNEFFPKSLAYNYPNPVYESETAIRYFVNEDAKINIKIFDLAGDFVAELNDFAGGGLEHETVWNVSTVQSGVYLARIEAAGNSGKTESNIIKIAVVK